MGYAMKRIYAVRYLGALLLMSNFALYAEMTQSEAHLSLPSNKALVDKWYNMKTNPYFKKLYDQVVQKERQYNNSHYVFYHGFTNAWRIPQDLYLKLYAKLHPLTINIQNYRSFRWLSEQSQASKEFLRQQLIEFGIVDDTKDRVKAFLLSTNLALFGDVSHVNECTFEYFLTAMSHESVKYATFKEILDIFDNPETYPQGQTPMLYKYIPQLMKLINHLRGEKLVNSNGKVYESPQTLSQIFIPKAKADDMAYASWVQGVPLEKELADWMTKMTHGRKAVKYTKFVDDVAKLFKDKQNAHPLFRKILNNIEEGQFSISKLLDIYKTDPKAIPSMNQVQARILFFTDSMHVSSGVKVYDYDRVPAANKKKYEQELDKIVNNIFKDVLSRASRHTKSQQSTGITSGLESIKKSINNLKINIKTYESGNLKQKTLAAVANGNTKVLDQNLAAKINIANYTLEDGLPLIFIAIDTKNSTIVKKVMDAGVNINEAYTVDTASIMPLDFAIFMNTKNIVQLLVNNGATINKQSIDLARSLKHADLVKILEKR